jgi:hypothetical protein
MPSNPYRIQITASSSTGGYGFYAADYAVRPFNIGIGCVVSTAMTASTGTYSIQHTFDYTGSSAFISSNATWFENSGISSKVANQDGNYAYSVTAIRLNVTSTSTQGATGSTSQPYLVSATIIQAG